MPAMSVGPGAGEPPSIGVPGRFSGCRDGCGLAGRAVAWFFGASSEAAVDTCPGFSFRESGVEGGGEELVFDERFGEFAAGGEHAHSHARERLACHPTALLTDTVLGP